MSTRTITRAKWSKTDERQRRFLRDLEKGEKTTDLIFLDYHVEPEELDGWIKSASFRKSIEDMRERMNFRLEQDLTRGAVIASARLSDCVVSGGGNNLPPPALVQAWLNAVKLFQTFVRSPVIKRRGQRALERVKHRHDVASRPSCYHRSHTPEKAAKLLMKLHKRFAKSEKLDRDQDEDGHWVPAD